MNLGVVCGLLKGNQMNIDTAESGEKCIELLGKNEYDLVFLDQRMPNMDGVETLKKLRSTYPAVFERTPVICLTANVLAEGKEMMLREGFTDYLTKPVTLPEMEKMLLKYLPANKVVMSPKPDEAEETQEPFAEDTDEIPASLRTIEEIDINKGLEYCGDAEDYLDAVDIFASSSKEKAEKLESYFKAQDYENLQSLAHSVKSTSRAIGAEKLSEAAALVESQTKNKDTESLEKSVPDLVTKYRSLGERLSL